MIMTLTSVGKSIMDTFGSSLDFPFPVMTRIFWSIRGILRRTNREDKSSCIGNGSTIILFTPPRNVESPAGNK